MFMRMLLLALVGTAALGQAQTGEIVVDIGTASGTFGGTVNVPVNLNVSGAAPSTLVFRVEYDVLALAYQSYVLGPIVPGDKVVSAEVGTAGVTFVIYGGTSSIQEGLLMTLRFTVIAPTTGTTILTGENGSASTPQAANIPVQFDDGSVTIRINGGVWGCPGQKAAAARTAGTALPTSNEPVELAIIPPDPEVPEMPGALAMWQISPENSYAASQEVLLPFPETAEPAAVYLFSGGYTWWEGTAVEGWLAEVPAVVDIDGERYLRLVVLHGGVVALALRPNAEVSEAAVMPGADLTLVIVAALALFACRHVGGSTVAIRNRA